MLKWYNIERGVLMPKNVEIPKKYIYYLIKKAKVENIDNLISMFKEINEKITDIEDWDIINLNHFIKACNRDYSCFDFENMHINTQSYLSILKFMNYEAFDNPLSEFEPFFDALSTKVKNTTTKKRAETLKEIVGARSRIISDNPQYLEANQISYSRKETQLEMLYMAPLYSPQTRVKIARQLFSKNYVEVETLTEFPMAKTYITLGGICNKKGVIEGENISVEAFRDFIQNYEILEGFWKQELDRTFFGGMTMEEYYSSYFSISKLEYEDGNEIPQDINSREAINYNELYQSINSYEGIDKLIDDCIDKELKKRVDPFIESNQNKSLEKMNLEIEGFEIVAPVPELTIRENQIILNYRKLTENINSSTFAVILIDVLKKIENNNFNSDKEQDFICSIKLDKENISYLLDKYPNAQKVLSDILLIKFYVGVLDGQELKNCLEAFNPLHIDALKPMFYDLSILDGYIDVQNDSDLRLLKLLLKITRVPILEQERIVVNMFEGMYPEQYKSLLEIVESKEFIANMILDEPKSIRII